MEFYAANKVFKMLKRTHIKNTDIASFERMRNSLFGKTLKKVYVKFIFFGVICTVIWSFMHTFKFKTHLFPCLKNFNNTNK